MSNVTPPPGTALPSPRALVRSTLIALAVAAVVLVGFILPAEYGVDPTGIGGVFGLTEMGQIKVQLAQEAEAEEAALAQAPEASGVAAPDSLAAADSTAAPEAERVIEIPLEPGEGKEVKLVMDEGSEVAYAWSTDRGVVNYDTHADGPGDPERGIAPISYHGYGKGMAVEGDEGVLVAAFDGNHGWFWRNRTRESVVVTLRARGAILGVVGP